GFRRSDARWDILGQQVFFAQRDNNAGPLTTGDARRHTCARPAAARCAQRVAPFRRGCRPPAAGSAKMLPGQVAGPPHIGGVRSGRIDGDRTHHPARQEIPA
ncbi:hypothetical protein, partial [Micromonospora sp. NPDC005173]|uniref:hypothetical protein n=1 Tax=Micromonospora sp. NPDC005173 TaxID=3157165 RepID=UPI0033B93418